MNAKKGKVVISDLIVSDRVEKPRSPVFEQNLMVDLNVFMASPPHANVNRNLFKEKEPKSSGKKNNKDK